MAEAPLKLLSLKGQYAALWARQQEVATAAVPDASADAAPVPAK